MHKLILWQTMHKLILWHDNEWAYYHRIADIVNKLEKAYAC